MIVLTYLSWVFVGMGAFLVLVGALGLYRFPDVYSRMHATGVTDTGAELMLIGFAFAAPDWQTLAKILFIGLFLLLTGPLSTHAVAHAAWIGGLNPMQGKNLRREDVTPDGDDDIMAAHEKQKEEGGA